jgi:hypothetical protein
MPQAERARRKSDKADIAVGGGLEKLLAMKPKIT